MPYKEKSHGGEAVASELPENPNPCGVQRQIDAMAIRASLRELPPSVWKDSAEWSLSQARSAKSTHAQRYHLRRWAVRWGCYTRSINGGFDRYAPAIFNSAAIASGLPVRYRAEPVRQLCRHINRVVWGED